MSKKDNKNGWTPERRRKQAEAIKKWRPWDQSTGPKTAAGKQEVSMNALKHGGYSDALTKYRLALDLQDAFLKQVEAALIHDAKCLRAKNKLMEKAMKTKG